MAQEKQGLLSRAGDTGPDVVLRRSRIIIKKNTASRIIFLRAWSGKYSVSERPFSGCTDFYNWFIRFWGLCWYLHAWPTLRLPYGARMVFFCMCSHIGNLQAMINLQASGAPCKQSLNFGKVSSLPTPPSRMACASFAHNIFVICALRANLAKIFTITFRGASWVGFARVAPLWLHSVNMLLIFPFKWAQWEPKELAPRWQQSKQLLQYFLVRCK